MSSKTSFFGFQSVKSPAEIGNCKSPREGFRPHTIASRSTCLYGSDASNTVCTTEKIAVFAPTAKASVVTAITVNVLFLRSCREAKRASWSRSLMFAPHPQRSLALRLLVPQRHHWVDFARPVGRNDASEQRD